MKHPSRGIALTLLSGAAVAGSLLASPAAPAQAAACPTGVDAMRIATSSGFLAEAQKRWGFGFTTGRTACGKLNRDGRADLVIQLEASQGTATSPSPWAVFHGTKRGFVRRFTRVKTIAYPVSISGRRVRLREPVYAKTDAGCCPSRIRSVQYRWTGHRYARKVTKTVRAPRR